MANLMISAALPWIGVFMAVRSAKDRRVKFLLLISGKARRRPNMVTAIPDSFAEAMRPFM